MAEMIFIFKSALPINAGDSKKKKIKTLMLKEAKTHSGAR